MFFKRCHADPQAAFLTAVSARLDHLLDRCRGDGHRDSVEGTVNSQWLQLLGKL